ncbi:MAG: MarR family transcriptional regulator [Spirosomaceae bacterium]|jgi:DNA-binding MarR family transcriptional regulator|nr:MarR family transcriptional regulator [Spirosomataceae bacterium]
MKNKLVELVNLWAKYEEENADLTIEDFCVKFLAENVEKPIHISDTQGIPVDGQLAGLIGRLNKYASLYCKKALEHVGMNNIDDWVYLISLHDMGTPKKSELIYEMVSEFPSGIDIIKRLVASELVVEFPDEQDKRSKRLKITPKGIQVLYESFPYMSKVGEMAFDTMNMSEKTMVLNILKRLDNYHAGHYKNVRNAEFSEAYELLTSH